MTRSLVELQRSLVEKIETWMRTHPVELFKVMSVAWLIIAVGYLVLMTISLTRSCQT
jgi:hypothetical protein